MAHLDPTDDQILPLPKIPGYRETRDADGKITLVNESEGNKDERQPRKTGSGHEKTSQMSLWEYVYSEESKRWHEEKFTDGSLNHLVITTSETCIPFREDDDYIDTNGKCILVAARHKENGSFPNDWIAVKKILLRGSEQAVNEAKKKFRQEIHNMQDLSKRRHHHIIAFISSYEKGELMGIAMFPVAKYSLKHLLEDMSRKNGEKKVDFSEHHHVWAMLRYFLCLSSAVAWLHSIPVKHKDIKPANILIDCAQSIILADFGLSRVYESKEAADISGGRTEYTLTYAPREAIDSTDRNLSTDLFSLACVFLEMVTVICGEAIKTLRGELKSRADPQSDSRPKCYASSEAEIGDWIKSLRRKSTHRAVQPLLVEGLERAESQSSNVFSCDFHKR
ncbi:Kinase-like protein [Lasiodiplodia theobromae]|uniref:Kinase-like protein n=1 Tax=Lasiodiplodia theobromae TaxID=45133 RepID=UPI0015C2FBFF|nr:Kinase-like protein [Lasiodiplodia theobromae]KAF4539329.1 Kinase-like protein [Lasiodiplodia theobromae]